MTIMINEEEAVKLLTAAVEERGSDFVYEKPDGESTCLYVHQDPTTGNVSPGCMVGLALNRAGIPLNVMQGDLSSAKGLLLALKRSGYVNYTSAASNIFSEVQHRQDTGIPWGDALDQGIAYYAMSPRTSLSGRDVFPS